MKLAALNEWSREAVACSVAFQRLGFGLEQVGAGVGEGNKSFVTLHHGSEQYNIVLGQLIDVSPDVYVGRWRAVIREIISGNVSEVELAELCHRSMLWNGDKMDVLVDALVARGFLNV